MIITDILKKHWLLTLILFSPVLLFLTLGLIFVLFAYSPTDHFVALTIPKYPNGTEYEVNSSVGFMSENPHGHASIRFYTKDSSKEVLEFYKTKLEKWGWKETPPIPEPYLTTDESVHLLSYKNNWLLSKRLDIRVVDGNRQESLKDNSSVSIWIKYTWD